MMFKRVWGIVLYGRDERQAQNLLASLSVTLLKAVKCRIRGEWSRANAPLGGWRGTYIKGDADRDAVPFSLLSALPVE